MRQFLFTLLFLISGCGSDQVLTYERVVEVEVPVYIETEVPVPVDTPAEDVEIWIDSFVQVRAVDGVDIIWVIDQSGSMNSYQSELLLGIDAMMSALPPSGWRLVMISTDPDAAVVEQQFPLVSGDDYSDAETMYNNMEEGQEESGFDAVYEYIENNNYAATWMRSEAALLVVFVSDEDDQSSSFTTSADFISWYAARRFGNVFLASIVMQEEVMSVCDPYGYGSDVGTRYMDATSMLFGTIVDICSDDWAPGMTDATTQIDPYESLQLTHEPIPQTVRVFVDGQLSYDWYFAPADNTVYFTVVPEGGKLVEIGYVIAEQDTGN